MTIESAMAKLTCRMTECGVHPLVSLIAPGRDMPRMERIHQGETAAVILREQEYLIVMFPRVVDGVIRLDLLDGLAMRGLLDARRGG